MKTVLYFILIFVLFTSLSTCSKNEQAGKSLVNSSIDEPQASSNTPGAETAAMATLLQDIHNSLDPQRNSYINADRAAMYQQLSTSATGNKKIDMKFMRGLELLKAGQTITAIQELKTVYNFMIENKIGLNEESELMLLNTLAISYMRQGEVQNCLNNHTQESCIFPIQGSGIHQLQDGSRAAINIYNNLLSKSPNDLSARYLLNVAYMTLGEYPEQVPEQWRINPAALVKEVDFPPFKDIAGNLGISVDDLCGGVVLEDFNRDGFLDLMVSSWSLEHQVRYFQNNGDGSFSDHTIPAGITGIVGGLNMIHGDYNNDGFPDVLILRGAWLGEGKHPNSLLKNNRDGTFEDVTVAAGIFSSYPTQAAVWADFNKDGWLDIFIGNESRSHAPVSSELFINQQNGTFKELSVESGIQLSAYIKGVAVGDMNNDGYPDLYFSCLREANKLYVNNGTNKDGVISFTETATQAGVSDPINSFPTWFFDYDNDGWQDIFVSGYDIDRYGKSAENMYREYNGMPIAGATLRLYRNKGNGSFEDVTTKMNLNKTVFTMGSNFGDIDNDGYLDFYLATGEPDFRGIVPNRMFQNNKGTNFQEVTIAGGFGHLQKGHGVAFGDLDNDGDQDIYTVLGGAYEGDNFPNALFQNPGMNNDWISLILEGTQTNKLAVGSRIKVNLTNDNGNQTLYRTVTSGGSFGASPFRLEVGLGANATINTIEVTWQKTGETQIFPNLKKNNCYKIVEGTKNAIILEYPTIEFPTSNSHAGHSHH